jgi:lysozyme family protein
MLAELVGIPGAGRSDQPPIGARSGGPPAGTWEAVAVDALMNCAPYAGHWTDWSTGGMLTLLEKYNGVGYAAKGRPSPYIWSGTDQYTSGKYVRDGVYDPNVVDAQLGCAGLLKAMMEIDPSIQFGPAGQPQRKTPEPPKRSPTTPPRASGRPARGP